MDRGAGGRRAVTQSHHGCLALVNGVGEKQSDEAMRVFPEQPLLQGPGPDTTSSPSALISVGPLAPFYSATIAEHAGDPPAHLETA